MADDEPGGDTQHAIARAPKLLIAERIEVDATSVHFAIDLDDETRLAADEVSDEAPDDDLPSEVHAELATVKLGPEPLFGEGGVVAQEQGHARLAQRLRRPLDGLAPRRGRIVLQSETVLPGARLSSSDHCWPRRKRNAGAGLGARDILSRE
jgi:hypothetical protein